MFDRFRSSMELCRRPRGPLALELDEGGKLAVRFGALPGRSDDARERAVSEEGWILVRARMTV